MGQVQDVEDKSMVSRRNELMKITLISNDISTNDLPRIYCFYSILRKHYDVEVMGACFGEGPYPIFDRAFPLKSYPGGWFPRFFRSVRAMVKDISGDVIIPDNYQFSSFGVAMLKKVISGKPVILGLSDYQRGLFSAWSKQSKKELLLDSNSLLYTVLMEKMIRYADEVLASSTFLMKKFGGVYLPHGRDTDALDPNKINGDYLREKYELGNKKVIIFCGKPTEHTNLDAVLDAMELLNRDDICILLVGANPHGEYEKRLLRKGGRWLKMIGLRPWKEVPYFLDMGDLVVLPQKDTPFTQAYTPAKMFEAMAMAKPIIATRISDMPEILKDCGIIVKVDEIGELADAIEKVLSSPDEAAEMGRRARHRCIEKYSWRSMERTLLKVLKKYE